MPLQATSGAASYDAFGGGVAVVPNYIEDVFSTWLVTGTGTAPAVNNGIDLAGKGGLVWIKRRSAAGSHNLFDTARGANLRLASNLTDAQDSKNLSFTNTGFSNYTFDDGVTEVSWTFRKQPKFFDVVTYTGTGSATTIAHNLGSVPGCIIVKRTDSAGFDWAVYHTSTGNTQRLLLNTTDPAGTSSSFWNNTTPTSTVFTVGSNVNTNASGGTYVAYLFAHNAGGFGLTGTDNVISCGSFTTPSSGNATITLGYESQWLMVKCSSNAQDWILVDNMRGLSQTNQQTLFANSSAAEEATASPYFLLTSTGFTAAAASIGGSRTFIYIAIRRGPMRTPTTGTSVYQASYFGSGASGSPAYISGFPIDFAIHGGMIDGSTNKFATDRLRGTRNLFTNLTDSEGSNASNIFYQNGFYNGLGSALSNYFAWMFRRAPGFHDEVCYTGNDVLRTITHNLGVAPEMMIIKNRDSALDWAVYHAGIGNTKYLFLNSTAAEATASSYWNNTSPTASVFTINTTNKVNSAPSPYVAYLFASAPGVSKVGSFTGTGTTQTINCGFTSGARFVLIKAASTSGNWLVWDSARGIVAGNDPYLALNSTAAEVTGTDWVDTAATGFELSNAGGNLANSSGVSYVFFAVA